ncbi:MAG TPA: MupA/Atu3671 family FMN-dependent luciferase-like monooxygenase, partial [Ktedonobacteraceae bacterium]|nr:MupA/Atu3671 family FMN-dependent luciferase-like monooxygenase [Ktedonobacteraceae bacterium]
MIENYSSQKTIVDLLLHQAHIHEHQTLYTFLSYGESATLALSYQDVHITAQAIATRLQQIASPGDRVLLLFQPGIDYLLAFFGCLYAGVIAVPVYPPNPARLQRTLPRLQSIVHDARPSVVLSPSAIQSLASTLLQVDPAFGNMEWLATDTIHVNEGQYWRVPAITGDSLAFLQYTSGSTADPKGVMVSHSNLLHNLSSIAHCFGHTSQSQGVIWLPPYHDMGLIGGILQPLYTAFPVTLLSPFDFLQKPFRWLEAITRYKATTSGGPDFSYDLCTRMISEEQKQQLDLSSWTVAFNGAEPVRAETMERFATAFASCGFRREAFYPCYGLAESTLMVSGGEVAARPVVQWFKTEALEQGSAVLADPSSDEKKRRPLVSSGIATPDTQVRLVDPQTHLPCSTNEVGEIWINSLSVAAGYWGQQELSQQIFHAHLANDQATSFLRTGDLGFLLDDQLFVTGRLKEVMIIRGRNLYPQDIEQTIVQSHAALRPNGTAVFSVEIDGSEQLVALQEVERHYRKTPFEEVVQAMRSAVAQTHEVALHAILLIKPGHILKTSSGKLRRRACRDAYLQQQFDVLFQDTLASNVPLREDSADEKPDVSIPSEHSDVTLLDTASEQERSQMLKVYLRAQLAVLLGKTPEQIDPQIPLLDLGLDSLGAVELLHHLERDLHQTFSILLIFQGANLSTLLEQLGANFSPSRAIAPEVSAPQTSYPLSTGQKALWFLHQLAPERSAYNLASAVTLSGSLILEQWQQAFQIVVERHPVLRSIFTIDTHGEPVQRIEPVPASLLIYMDTASWSQERLQTFLQEEARRPFVLQQEHPLRVILLRRSEHEHILLFVIHHIVSDFWSISQLFNELKSLISKPDAQLSASMSAYSDYVSFQAEQLQTPELEAHWNYWQEQLALPLPVIELPADYPRPALPSYRGASYHIRISSDVTARLKSLARKQQVTLYTLLLTAFQSYLARYTSQDDIVVGSPVAYRPTAQFAATVGYFVNPLVLRMRVNEQDTLISLLQQMRQTTMEAFEHQAYPFALLAERLDPYRDMSRSPVFQIMFLFQKTQSAYEESLAALALGAEGISLQLGNLQATSIELQECSAPFDLTLAMAELHGELRASFQYSTDLFRAPTIERMARHFHNWLKALVQAPEQPIASLSLLSLEEQRAMIQKWNATDQELPELQDMVTLFETQALHAPEARAVIFEQHHLTYGELHQRANQLASYLRALGVGPDTLVGLSVTRSLDLVVGLLGILKAGGAYVPLDPHYPQERLRYMAEDAGLVALITQASLCSRFQTLSVPVLCLDTDWSTIASCPQPTSQTPLPSPDRLAYVIYTSGSTGRPKGVEVTHRNLLNFCLGMDKEIGCHASDTMLALTSISFDISVLEIFWPLTHGACVVLVDETFRNSAHDSPVVSTTPIDFSLFYFANADALSQEDQYQLLFEGATFADHHGFSALWTPERHFHAFGGSYPNPSVTSAALATLTQRIQIRAGSVVLPLHHTIRVAEEWSLVDNLSRGRVGIAFASGWHANDFAFFPERFSDRKECMFQQIEELRQLWRGETIKVIGGAGNEIDIQLYPKPRQPMLPLWLTAAGSPDTFVKAGELGLGVLTHLLGQSIEQVGANIRRYRQAFEEAGHDPRQAHVTLMLHTFIGQDLDEVRNIVRQPFIHYLRTSVGLIESFIRSMQMDLDLQKLSEQDMDALLNHAFERYFETSSLCGTPASCLPLIERLKQIGVNEIACLIDFGIPVQKTLAGLQELAALKDRANPVSQTEEYHAIAQAQRYQPTLMQCTPSLMRLLMAQNSDLAAFHSLRTLLLGGESLPVDLAQAVRTKLPARILNMYGPTETTIWSLCHEVIASKDAAIIGRPIANTQMYVLNGQRQLVPPGVPGELYL